MKFVVILIFVAIIGLVLYFVFQCKKIKVSNVFMVCGGVKVGKSAFSIYLVNSLHTYALIGYLLRLPFVILFKKNFDYINNVPAIVSNIPLRKLPHIPLTLDMIERKVIIPYKSVMLLDEASLIADQFSFRNEKGVCDLLNEKITLFVKLFGHATHGGYCVLNTQSMSDLHYGFKRNISNYVWIHSKTKLPFFVLFRVREMTYSEDNNTINVVSEDVEDNLKWLLMPKKVFKYYDCYCYSVLTDNLDMIHDSVVIKKRSDLKANTIISFRDFKTIPKGVTS